MKIKNIIYVFSILFLFLLIGCTNKETNFKLQIRESSWSGSSENYKPEEVTNKYNIVLKKEYNVDSGSFIFKITKINSDSIIIETMDAFSDQETGINLNTTKKKFKVSFDKELRLATPTMDAGKEYYLKLVK